MDALLLHDWHAGAQARFIEVKGREAVASYGQALTELRALRATVGVLDLSFRSRLCVTGEDRQRFLHGQVTNDVNALRMGEGCYATLVTAKGKMVSDLNIYRLPDELLLDLEPGYGPAVQRRLEQFIVAEDVQVVDVAPYCGLLSVQGPKAEEALRGLVDVAVPEKLFDWAQVPGVGEGDVYLLNHPRFGTKGFDLLVPTASLASFASRLGSAAQACHGCWCGWEAAELIRVESGIPRFGVDMDETNLPPEAGLDARAISYKKGCYIGQEVINRIRTYGQVAKSLRGLELADDLPELPARGDKLFHNDKEVGYVTSAIHSPSFVRNIGLGYVRREVPEKGGELTLRTRAGESRVRVVPLPFGEKFA